MVDIQKSNRAYDLKPHDQLSIPVALSGLGGTSLEYGPNLVRKSLDENFVTGFERGSQDETDFDRILFGTRNPAREGLAVAYALTASSLFLEVLKAYLH